MAKLLVRHPELGDASFTLSGDRVTVGRDVGNGIRIDYCTISGVHAELLSRNGRHFLRDLDSTNHCFIDGIQVSEAELNARCRLLIGTVECEYVPDAPPEAVTQTGDPESLRKTICVLRSKNEELLAKVGEQQSQINILGNARFLTPADGADLAGLRKQIAALTAERDKLAEENKRLRAQIDGSGKKPGSVAIPTSELDAVPV